MKPRWSTLLLGVLLLAQGAAKLVAMRGYVTALAAFRVFPVKLLPFVATIWMSPGDLRRRGAAAHSGLSRKPIRQTGLYGATGAVIASVGYVALTTSAWLRGLVIFNCTCFGAFLPQRLSPWVLLQDIAVALWATRQLLHIARWPSERVALPLQR